MQDLRRHAGWAFKAQVGHIYLPGCGALCKFSKSCGPPKHPRFACACSRGACRVGVFKSSTTGLHCPDRVPLILTCGRREQIKVCLFVDYL
jgi:hypothetical protein